MIKRPTIIFILALALAVRLSYFAVGYQHNPNSMMEIANKDARHLKVDSEQYETCALSMLHEGRFLNDEGKPETWITPGYPAFLAMIYVLAGHRKVAVILAQIILSTLTVLALYMLTRHLWGHRAGLLAALILAVDPLSITMTVYIMTETLFVFLFVISLYFAVRAIESHAIRWSLAWGAVLALCALTRPVAYYLIFAIMIVFLAARRTDWRTAFMQFGFICIPWLLVVGGWQVRNYIQTGRPDFSMAGDVAVRLNQAAEIMRLETGKPLADVREQIYQEGLTTAQARQYVLSHKLTMARVMVEKLWLFWAWPVRVQMTDYLGIGPVTPGNGWFDRWIIKRPGQFLFVQFDRAFMILIYVGAIAGLIAAWKSGAHVVHLFFIGVVFYFIIITVGGGMGYWRYRFPIMPILYCYAAAGLGLIVWPRKREL